MPDISLKILLVDDETDILEFLSYNLIKNGFTVDTALNGKIALDMIAQNRYDLVVLDVMMPELDGIATCEAIKSQAHHAHLPIVFLTARGEDFSQLAGFAAGADDYITKPINPKLFISRIHAILRRTVQSSPTSVEESDPHAVLTINRERFIVVYLGKEYQLPKKEFELLELLASKPNKVFTRSEIYNAVWGDHVVVGDRTIDVHVRKIRERMNIDRIKTIKGVGYKYED